MADAAPSFEESLQQLQAIVAELESGTLSLEAALARFEQGVKFVQACHQLLSGAEQRIELLTGFDRAGQPITTPIKVDATFDPENGAARPKKARRTSAVEPSAPVDPHESNSLFS